MKNRVRVLLGRGVVAGLFLIAVGGCTGPATPESAYNNCMSRTLRQFEKENPGGSKAKMSDFRRHLGMNIATKMCDPIQVACDKDREGGECRGYLKRFKKPPKAKTKHFAPY